MQEDDNLNGVAGASAGDNVQPSEASAVTNLETPEAKRDDATADNANGESEAADAGNDAGDKPKRPSGAQRNREKIAQLEAQLAELQARIGAGDRAATPPKLDDFPDYDQFEIARQKFAAKEALREAAAEDARGRIDNVHQERMQTLIDDHNARAAEVRELIPDYDKVLNSYSGPKGSPELHSLLLESPKSELLAYHLATRPDLVRNLNSLPPVALARELGRIEARLSRPQPKTATNAPAPVSGVKGGSSSQTASPLKSMSDYERWRNAK